MEVLPSPAFCLPSMIFLLETDAYNLDALLLSLGTMSYLGQCAECTVCYEPHRFARDSSWSGEFQIWSTRGCDATPHPALSPIVIAVL